MLIDLDVAFELKTRQRVAATSRAVRTESELLRPQYGTKLIDHDLNFIGPLPIVLREVVIRYLVGETCRTTSTNHWPPFMADLPGQVVDATQVLGSLNTRPVIVARGSNEIGVSPVDGSGMAAGEAGTIVTPEQYAAYRSQPVADYIRKQFASAAGCAVADLGEADPIVLAPAEGHPDHPDGAFSEDAPFALPEDTPEAQSGVGKKLLDRIKNDVKTSAVAAREQMENQLRCMTHDKLQVLRDFVRGFAGDGASTTVLTAPST